MLKTEFVDSNYIVGATTFMLEMLRMFKKAYPKYAGIFTDVEHIEKARVLAELRLKEVLDAEARK